MKFSTLVVFMLLYTVKYVQDSPTVILDVYSIP